MQNDAEQVAKRQLSDKICQLIADFERSANGDVVVTSIKLERMRIIGPKRIICVVSTVKISGE